MKISRKQKEPEFEPIVITLETQQEAEWLKAVANDIRVSPESYKFTNELNNSLRDLGIPKQTEEDRLLSERLTKK